jgi:acyl-CoA synthetase (NDP forming)
MKKFMEPRSVALIGISSEIRRGSLNLLGNLLQIGFPGKIFPVNPKIQKLLDQKVYPDIYAIPEDIDLAVIMTPRQIVPTVLEQCTKRGIDSVLIITQGFAEADGEGNALQSRISELIKKTGVRVLGPNSIGIINHFVPFSTYFISIKKEESPIAFVSQSGGFLEGFPQFKIGKGIDLGNTCDIDFCEALTYFEDDPQIKVIGLYMEGIKNGDKFIKTAGRVARKKLILILKPGKSDQGVNAIISHSGSLAGEEATYEAVFKQAGLIRIRNVEEFGDISKAYLNLPLIRGNHIGVITPTGGGGVLVADASQEYGFSLRDLSEGNRKPIKELFPPWQQVKNPLDIMSATWVHGYKNVYTKTLETLVKDTTLDAIFCVLGEPTLKTVGEIARRYPTRPIISWVIGQSTDLAREIASAVCYPSPERAFRSLAALLEHNAFIMKTSEGRDAFLTDRKSVEEILERAKKQNEKILTIEAFSILSAYGIPIAPFKIAKTKSQAVEVAEELKYPVALKVYSPEILHKSQINGVRVGIRSSNELNFHYEDMITGVLNRAPNMRIEGVIVQKLITEGVEVILGVKRDLQFGPVIVFGWGGVFTEVLKDFSCGIPPITSEDADRMISSTKVSKVLEGFQSNLPSDRSFLKECILRLSQLVSEFPGIVELDINPIKVLSKGGLAIDARMVVDLNYY